MRVLIAVDLSEAADVAVREAVVMASAPGDVLAAVHVLRIPPRESLFFPARDETLVARAADLVSRVTTLVRERVAKIAPPGTEVFVDEGIEYATIVRRAEAFRADVIALGSHGHSGLSRVLGDVACKVVRHAHCSVLVARETKKRGCVVVGTDYSAASLVAITVAAAEARQRRAKLIVAHARGFTDLELAYVLQITPSITTPPTGDDVMPEALRQAISKLGVETIWQPLDGSAATAIARHAESVGAELVVVGTHGETALARLTLGSVAEKVVCACSCSVLVVRASDPSGRR